MIHDTPYTDLRARDVVAFWNRLQGSERYRCWALITTNYPHDNNIAVLLSALSKGDIELVYTGKGTPGPSYGAGTITQETPDSGL